jgi:DNA-binding MarR family transcriptional regulator
LEKITVRNRFRRGARFIADARQHCRPLDRNERARILTLAEQLERRTKPEGGRCGVLGLTGLAVLRALVCGFLRRSDGLCCPSVSAIREKTGLSRSVIFEALNKLEAAGIITRTRRLVRKVVSIGGLARLTTVQGSNLYAFAEPHTRAHLLPIISRTRNNAARLVAKLAKVFSSGAGSGKRTVNQLDFSFQEESRAFNTPLCSIRGA